MLYDIYHLFSFLNPFDPKAGIFSIQPGCSVHKINLNQVQYLNIHAEGPEGIIPGGHQRGVECFFGLAGNAVDLPEIFRHLCPPVSGSGLVYIISVINKLSTA